MTLITHVSFYRFRQNVSIYLYILFPRTSYGHSEPVMVPLLPLQRKREGNVLSFVCMYISIMYIREHNLNCIDPNYSMFTQDKVYPWLGRPLK